MYVFQVAAALDEQTSAPFKLHPVEIDITLKPASDPPEELQKILNELIKRLPREGPKENLLPQNTENSGGSGEIYIIAALVLVILVLLAAGGFCWFRSHKLKAEIRSLYPVAAVSNSEYMDPRVLANGEKFKGVP